MAVEETTRSLRAFQDIPTRQMYPELLEIALERAIKWGSLVACVPRESCDRQCPKYRAHMEALHHPENPAENPPEQRPRRRRRYEDVCSRVWLGSMQDIGPALLALAEAEDAGETVKEAALKAEETVQKAASYAEEAVQEALSQSQQAERTARGA